MKLLLTSFEDAMPRFESVSGGIGGKDKGAVEVKDCLSKAPMTAPISPQQPAAMIIA